MHALCGACARVGAGVRGEVRGGIHTLIHIHTCLLSSQNRTCRASLPKLPARLHGSRRASSSLVSGAVVAAAAAAAGGEEEGLRAYDDEGEDSQQAAGAGASWSHAASSCRLVRELKDLCCVVMVGGGV